MTEGPPCPKILESMHHALSHLLLVVALILGQLPMVTAIYDCSISGKRSLSACCCASRGGCSDAERPPEQVNAAAGAELRAICCSLSQELHASTLPTLRTPGSEPWKDLLERAGGMISFCASLPRIAGEHYFPASAPGPCSLSVGRLKSTPLFIVHCQLLI